MTKTMNRLSKVIITGACALLLFTFSKPFFSDSQPFLSVDPKDVISLEGKTEFTINMGSLVDPLANRYLNQIIFKSALDKLSKGQKPVIPVLIDSYGGYIGLMGRTAQVMAFSKALGAKFRCYVTNAYSAAFFLLVTQCDERIVLKGAKVGQHLVHIGRNMTTAEAILLSRRMAKAEAAALKEDFESWYALTRQVGEDKYFNEEEMLDYDIATEIYERPKSSSK